MLITIENEVLENYPETEIGYLLAEVTVRKNDPFVENLKEHLESHLTKQNINATNFVTHPNISQWRKIYEEDFQIKARTHRSSIEALLRRVVTGKKIWNICNIVDLYNCNSVLSLLPMGGYDLEKVTGEITIRYAKEGEPFWGLGEKKKITAQSNHVVYADNQRILCWLWNHKDSAETSIDENSKYVLFFIDSFDHANVQLALNHLAGNVTAIQCTPLEKGILNRNTPQTRLQYVPSIN